MVKNSMLIVGLDLGDRCSYLTILDQDGELIEESRLPTTKVSLQGKFSNLQPCRVAMEVGAHSRWASQLLKDLGHEVLVANARKLRAVYSNPRKGDRADPQAQADLAALRSRDALVRSRTLLINHVRSVAKSSGARLPSCSADSFSNKAAASIPQPLCPALLPLLETIASLTKQIHAYDRQITSLGETRYPETQPLRRIDGVGPITALAFVLTLEDPSRFQKSREVGPAIGLVPRTDQSGDRDPQLRITKTGNSYLRRLLVNSAQYMLGPFGPECELRTWGPMLAERGGKNAKKRAVVAVARKLAILLHRLWKNGEIYDPFYRSRSNAGQPVIASAAA